MGFKTLFITAALLAALPYHFVSADSPTTEKVHRDTEEIFSSLVSPFCPGRLLRDCPSSAATDLKRSVAADLEGGKSKDEVIESLIVTYGEEMRAAPRGQGFGWFAWITPFAFIVLGILAFALWLKVRRNSILADNSKQQEKADLEAPLDPAMQKRIDGALRSDE